MAVARHRPFINADPTETCSFSLSLSLSLSLQITAALHVADLYVNAGRSPRGNNSKSNVCNCTSMRRFVSSPFLGAGKGGERERERKRGGYKGWRRAAHTLLHRRFFSNEPGSTLAGGTWPALSLPFGGMDGQQPSFTSEYRDRTQP